MQHVARQRISTLRCVSQGCLSKENIKITALIMIYRCRMQVTSNRYTNAYISNNNYICFRFSSVYMKHTRRDASVQTNDKAQQTADRPLSARRQ